METQELVAQLQHQNAQLQHQNAQVQQQNAQVLQQNAQVLQQNAQLLQEQARALEFGEDASTVVRAAVATLLLSGRYDEANDLAARADKLETTYVKCRERRADMLVQHQESTNMLLAMQVGTSTGAAGHKSKHLGGTASWTECCAQHTRCSAAPAALEGCGGMGGVVNAGLLSILVEGYFNIGLLKCVL